MKTICFTIFIKVGIIKMRLTTREKEIYDFLKKEPLISQDELAHHFRISRSSVAVHISNLMKKGFVLGKGYVFNEQVTVVLLGEACQEISIIENQGDIKIDVRLTGFALELSKILGRFGVNVKVITIIGDDEVGTSIASELVNNNLDTGNIYKPEIGK